MFSSQVTHCRRALQMHGLIAWSCCGLQLHAQHSCTYNYFLQLSCSNCASFNAYPTNTPQMYSLTACSNCMHQSHAQIARSNCLLQCTLKFLAAIAQTACWSYTHTIHILHVQNAMLHHVLKLRAHVPRSCSMFNLQTAIHILVLAYEIYDTQGFHFCIKSGLLHPHNSLPPKQTISASCTRRHTKQCTDLSQKCCAEARLNEKHMHMNHAATINQSTVHQNSTVT